MNTEWKNPLEELDLLTQEEFDALPDEIVNGIYKGSGRLIYECKLGREWILINRYGVPMGQGFAYDDLWQSKCNSLAIYITEWRKQRAMFKKPVEQWDDEVDPHRYNKLLYAEDCKHSNAPWFWWQEQHKNSQWYDILCDSIWLKGYQYRRNPDAPKRFIDFQMDLTDCTEEQFRQVQKWLFEQGYSWIQHGEEYISKMPPFTKIRTHKDGDIVRGCPSYTYTDCPTLTLEELGIQFEQEDPHKPELNPDEQLRDNALERFQKKAYEKFNYGMAEHNPFNDRPLTDRASFIDLEDEIIDLWMYVQAMKEKLNQ
jgi:hypothetical protein